MSEDRLEHQEKACGVEELLHLTTRGWEKGEGFVIAGLEGGSKGFFINLLGREVSPLLVITPDQDGAEALYETILFFTPPEGREGILLFPSDGIPYGDIPPLGLLSQRMRALRF